MLEGFAQGFAVSHFPQLRSSVLTRGQHGLPVLAEGSARKGSAVMHSLPFAFALVYVPKSGCFVGASRENRLAVGTERDRHDGGAVAQLFANGFAGSQLPKPRA